MCSNGVYVDSPTNLKYGYQNRLVVLNEKKETTSKKTKRNKPSQPLLLTRSRKTFALSAAKVWGRRKSANRILTQVHKMQCTHTHVRTKISTHSYHSSCYYNYVHAYTDEILWMPRLIATEKMPRDECWWEEIGESKSEGNNWTTNIETKETFLWIVMV